MRNLRKLAESAAKHEGKTDVHALTDSEADLIETINGDLLLALLDVAEAAKRARRRLEYAGLDRNGQYLNADVYRPLALNLDVLENILEGKTCPPHDWDDWRLVKIDAEHRDIHHRVCKACGIDEERIVGGLM